MTDTFIAVSNDHGWGRGTTVFKALEIAFENSTSSGRKDKALRIKAWKCVDKAYVDGMGTVHGVLDKGTEFKRQGKHWVLV